MGQVEAYERNQEILSNFESKCQELRTVFALADPTNYKPREIPDHLVDMVCGARLASQYHCGIVR
jgi:STIP1 family protein 1